MQNPPSSELGTRLPVQDYAKLRRQCLAQNTLFEDPYFPADDSSLFYTQRLPFTPKWIRPKVCHCDAKIFITNMVWDEITPKLNSLASPSYSFESLYPWIVQRLFWLCKCIARAAL